MTITLYGIPNCDTVKKARAWLDSRGFAYAFHDYKKLGADPARLAQWQDRAGWEKVINRAGPTFRKLPEADREGLDVLDAPVGGHHGGRRGAAMDHRHGLDHFDDVVQADHGQGMLGPVGVDAVHDGRLDRRQGLELAGHGRPGEEGAKVDFQGLLL